MAKRILIVDDEPRYLRLLEANLRTEGYEVVTAQDGAQAVDVFSNQPIDLVLMDVMMPKLDGFRCHPTHPRIFSHSHYYSYSQRR